MFISGAIWKRICCYYYIALIFLFSISSCLRRNKKSKESCFCSSLMMWLLIVVCRLLAFFSLDPPLFRLNKKWFACWLINYFTLRLRHGWTMKRKRTEWISKAAGVYLSCCVSQGCKERKELQGELFFPFVTLMCLVCMCVKLFMKKKSILEWRTLNLATLFFMGIYRTFNA